MVRVEPVSETSGLIERVPGRGQRVPDVHAVHNVLVHPFDEGGRRPLQVSLHAKVTPDLSLAEPVTSPKRSSGKFSGAWRRRTYRLAHRDPGTIAFGRDVTSSRQDIVWR